MRYVVRGREGGPRSECSRIDGQGICLAATTNIPHDYYCHSSSSSHLLTLRILCHSLLLSFFAIPVPFSNRNNRKSTISSSQNTLVVVEVVVVGIEREVEGEGREGEDIISHQDTKHCYYYYYYYYYYYTALLWDPFQTPFLAMSSMIAYVTI